MIFLKASLALVFYVCLVAWSCPTLQPYGLQPARLLHAWDSLGKNTGAGSLSLLQEIFLTQGSDPSLLLCRQILYCLSHQESSSFLPSVPFSSVAQSCPTYCNPMNHSTPGLPVHHQLPKFTQTYVDWVGHAIQPSHSLFSPSSPTLDLSQHQGFSSE